MTINVRQKECPFVKNIENNPRHYALRKYFKDVALRR